MLLTILATLGVLGAAVLGAAVLASGVAAADGVPIASGDFGRPTALGQIDAWGDAKVAMAAGPDGPVAVWEDGQGIVLAQRPAGPQQRLRDTRGVRGLWAGSADGHPLIVWAERDLADGTTTVRWYWRGEERRVLTVRQTPRIRTVANAQRPELVAVLIEAGGWTVRHHAWDGTVRDVAVRDEKVAGLDALRGPSALHVAWLEGTTESVLGQVDADWAAYATRWADEAATPDPPERWGPALRLGDRDVIRLAHDASGTVQAAWPTEAGLVARSGPNRTLRTLGEGRLLGRLQDRWTWVDGVHLVQERGERAERVVRLPSAPEHLDGRAAAGTTGVVFSSGRYLGGLTVWAVDDAEPYRPTWIDRLAVAMDWDPWRPGSEAAGHAALAFLAATLIAVAVAPLWWIGAALLGRRGLGSGRRVWIEGGVLGAGLIVAGVAGVSVAADLDDATMRALTGGPVWWVVAAGIGLVAARVAVAGRDVEPTMGRLLAAFAGGFATSVVLAGVTTQAWLRLVGASA
ncbi:MAG: hypothetical protein WD336_03405 [Trueperaceae bacterium]